MRTRRLTYDALLTAVALTIFVIEAQIPVPVPVPGIKLGLSNIVTLFAMFTVGPYDALGILLCRVILGSMVTGQMSAVFFSLAGGLLCYLLTLILRKLMSRSQIWLCSIFGAIAHNIGQMAAAIAVTQTPSLLVYMPALMISGIIAGAFTGICAQILINRYAANLWWPK